MRRRGDSLSCSEQPDSKLDHCWLRKDDGTLRFDDTYVPYGGGPPARASELRIEPLRTREDSLWVGYAFALIVHLENGRILIPSKFYRESVSLLDGRMKKES